MLLAQTAGEVLAASADRRAELALLRAALPGAQDTSPAGADPAGARSAAGTGAGVPSVRVTVQACAAAFELPRAAVVTRGVRTDGTWVCFTDACSSGFDLLVRPGPAVLEVLARYRPAPRTRAANRALPARFVLLARQVLLQYPALWWAGVHGRSPLHASAVSRDGQPVLLAGPGGVGKSTMLLAELGRGAVTTSDNLCVSDGRTAYGVLEPIRVQGGVGRRTSHGRREQPLTGRVPALLPVRLVALRRAAGTRTSIHPMDPDQAARTLVAGTYAAGELRRYWAFAASLALATGVGPAHPPVAEVAGRLAAALPCLEAVVGDGDRLRLADLMIALDHDKAGATP